MEKRRNRKLSLKEILENIEPSDIKTFVHQYAKNDKAFEVILKAHFISRFTSDDQDLKYNRILSEIIKPRTLANPKLTGTAKKTVLIVLEDFTYQMADLLSIEDYHEAFYVIKNSLDKIAYLQNTYLLNDKTIDKFRITFLNGLSIILGQDLAPAFRAKMEDLLRVLIKKSYYYPAEDNLISLLDDHNVLSVTDKKVMIEDLILKIEKEIDSKSIIMTLIQLAFPIPKLTNKILKKISHKQIFQSLSEFILKRRFKLVSFYIEDEEIKYDLHKTALNCMLQHEKADYKALSTTLNSLNTENTPPNILKNIIDHLSPSYLRQEYKQIEKWIVSLPFSLQCNIYARTEDYKKLVKALKEHKEIEWVKVYDKLLIEKGERDKVKEIYLHCADHYLENHIGNKAVEYIARINYRLTSIGEREMLLAIQEKLFDKFSHRTSVP